MIKNIEILLLNGLDLEYKSYNNEHPKLGVPKIFQNVPFEFSEVQSTKRDL